ncbi:MAG: type II toxin-antitoxin system VapC family toxin [Acidimicrobiales bacterium]
MIVLDASAVVEWLLDLPLAREVTARLSPDDQTLHAPHLLSVEVAQVVRRYVAASEMSAERGVQALTDLADLDVVHHAHEPLLPTMWRLRSNLTAYDAAYVALALALEVPLVTLDARLAAAPVHGATVDLIR